MITSNSCWLKDSCKKYRRTDCECRFNDIICPKLFKLDRLYSDALLSDVQRKHIILKLDSDCTDSNEFKKLSTIEKNIVDYVKNGNNLYIHSVICGNGKTAWAIRLVQAYLNEIWWYTDMVPHALFINVPRFLLALKDSISNQNDYVDHIKKYVLSADLVVWDEVATKTLTTYEHEHLLSLINARLDTGKSNIYTSNLSPNDLRETLGDRLYSRIVNLSDEIVFNGKDKRGINKQWYNYNY